MTTMSNKNKYKSVIILICVNLFPIIGVLHFGWNVFEIIILYVIETFIIGVSNTLKMNFSDSPRKTFWIPFFLFHYNFFIIMQTIFIVMLFGAEDHNVFMDNEGWNHFFLVLSKNDILFSILIITLSHSFSFYFNFFKKRLYERLKIDYFFVLPYRRIFVQQFIVVLGGWISLKFNVPMTFLIILIVTKTLIDLWTHMNINAILKGSIKEE